MASSPPNNSAFNSRPMSSSSRSMHGSQSIFPGASSSRPFLNMLNPMMGRGYQGYMQANQSVLEEEEEDPEHTTQSTGGGDLEAGQMRRSLAGTPTHKAQRRGAWAGEASEMSLLRPNIKQDDQKHIDDSSDDEVPQDFMIEAAVHPAARKPQSPTRPRGASFKGKEREQRKTQPLYSLSSRKPTPPILPSSGKVSIPPRPSELDTEEPLTTQPMAEPKQKQMRGLDAYERALWNWVNVYNLDAFLQEAYYYYEGKGIYSIALSRGLNLLLVIVHLQLLLVYVHPAYTFS